VEGRITPVRELDRREMGAWHALAQGSVEPNPFFEPANVVPAARHIPGGDELVLAIAEHRGQMCGALPLRRFPHWKSLFRPVLSSRGLVTPAGLGRIGMPLLAVDRAEAALAQLLSVLARRGTAGILLLEAFGETGPTAGVLHEVTHRLHMPTYVYDRWSRPVITRAAGFEPAPHPKRVKRLARQRDLLCKELGGPAELVDRSGSAAWVERYLELESVSRKGPLPAGATALVSQPGAAQWFRQSALELAEQGSAHLFSLEANGRPLAMNYVLCTPGQAFFGFKMCYDDTLRAYAPGMQLIMDIIDFVREGTEARFFDSCMDPGNRHFDEFFPQMRQMSNVLVGLKGAVDRVGVAGAPAIRPVARRFRRFLPGYGHPGAGEQARPAGGAAGKDVAWRSE
jgi:CelD/BcsL family acetyltransferase involved in cellulose biosynthesis